MLENNSLWKKYKNYIGSLLLLLSIALFIPAPRSDVSDLYAFSAMQIIQILLFLASRLFSGHDNKQMHIIPIVGEVIIFTAIVFIHIEAINIY